MKELKIMKNVVNRALAAKKTNILVNNTIMKTYMKYLCAVLMIVCTSASAWGVDYQKVTDVSQLSTGDQVILTNNMGATGSGYAMSKTVSGQFYGRVSVNSSSNKISNPGSDVMVLTVKLNGSGNLIAFWTGDGWLYDDGSNNHLKVNSGSWSTGLASGANWVWGLALSSGTNPNYCIDLLNEKCRADKSNRWLQHNGGNGFKSTSTYSTYADLCIWKVGCSSPFGSLSVGGGATVTWSGSNIEKTVSLTGQNGSGAKTWSFDGSVASSVATISGSGSSATVTIKGVGGAQSKTLKVKCHIAANGDYCEEENTINITVNAQSYTYTYKANGGTGDDQTQTVYHGKSATLKANNTFTAPSCKQFKEWNTKSTGDGSSYDAGANVTPSGALTLYAIWEDMGPYTVTTAVSPAASGTATIGGLTSKSCACGATGIALMATPNSGYYFNNWTKSPNNATGGVIASANSASTTYNVGMAATTLTANFLPYLTLTYDANNGSGAPAAKTDCQSGVSFTLSSTSPTRSNYQFLGWNTSNTATTAQKQPGDSYSITGNTTLYAVWCPVITGASLTVSGTEPTFNYSTGKGSTTFSWGTVTNATAYQLVIRNTTDGEDVYSNSVSAGSNYTFTEMTPGKTYRATVTASNACTNTSGYVDKSIACPAMAGTPTIDLPGTIGKTSVTIDFSLTNAVSFNVWLTNGDGSSDLGTIAVAAEEIAATSGAASKTFTISADQYYYVHATGKNICGNVSSERSSAFQAGHEATWDHYQFACVSFAATVPSGKAYVTSGNGKTILSKNPVHLVITGAIANHFVQIEPSDATISVYFVKDDKYQVVNGSNQLRIGNDGTFAKDIYFAYTPSAVGDGSVTAPTFTVRCDGYEQTFNADGSLLKVRAMPENYAVINKVGSTWYILPADMGDANGTQPAVAVRVDNNDNPTTAYTEAADNAFRIWPIDGSGANRFKSTAADENGSIIRMSMPNNLYEGNALAFGASSSSTAIGAFSHTTLTSSTATAGSHFYWDITTTENVVGGTTYLKYELFNPARGSGNKLVVSSKKWGTYNGITQETRFVKIEETKDAELTIMEWGQASVVIRYSGSGTIALTSVSVDNTAVGTATMSRIGTSDLYAISGLSTMQANPSKLIVISINETVAAVTTAKESAFFIPFIISNGQTKNNTELRDLMAGSTEEKKALAKTVDVVVCNGGEFDTNSGADSFSDLYIYPGGKVNLGHNIGLQNIYLRGGFSWLDATFALPQLNVTDDISITGLGTSGHGVFYDLYLNNSMYYMMALPKDVALNAVTNEEGGDAWDAWVKGYSGKPRALNPGNKGWSYVSGDYLERGKGYEIAIKPRLGRPYGTLRFPLLSSTAWSNETACSPNVVAWGMTDGEIDEGVTPNNAGWNLIGNPFFTAYNNTSVASIIITDSLTKKLDDSGNWTGTYEWSETPVKYFTIPNYTTEDYTDVRAIPHKLDAFYPFFVQVKSGTEASPASLTFATANRALKMPQRIASREAEREVNLDIQLADESDHKDVMGLNISNEYSPTFDEDDKEKTILGGENYMKIYTLVGDYRVAFNSLSENAAEQLIPIGVITPEAGYYTFSLVEDLDVSEIEHVWLWDYEKSSQTDLLVEDYQFYGTPGQLDDRFAINVILKNVPEITTDVDVMNLGVNDVPYKFIWNDQIYIMYHGVVYDATGRRVNVINK